MVYKTINNIFFSSSTTATQPPPFPALTTPTQKLHQRQGNHYKQPLPPPLQLLRTLSQKKCHLKMMLSLSLLPCCLECGVQWAANHKSAKAATPSASTITTISQMVMTPTFIKRYPTLIELGLGAQTMWNVALQKSFSETDFSVMVSTCLKFFWHCAIVVTACATVLTVWSCLDSLRLSRQSVVCALSTLV